MVHTTKNKLVIFLSSHKHQQLSENTKSSLSKKGLTCVDFGHHSPTSYMHNTHIYAVVLFSLDVLNSMEFMSAWYDILCTNWNIFNFRADSTSVLTVPTHFGKVEYYDFNEDTPELLFNSIIKDIKLAQPRIVANNEDAIPEREKFQQNTINLQALRRSWVKIHNYAKKEDAYYDDYAYSHYNELIEANLLTLEELLTMRRYSLEPLIRFSIPKTNDSQSMRLLYQAQPETALILQAVCDVISPIIEAKLINQTYGNRFIISNRDETTEIFYDYWTQYQKYIYAAVAYSNNNPSSLFHRLDIKQYYPRINTIPLMEKLRNIISEPFVLEILDNFLNLPSITESGTLESSEILGLPAGLPISHLLGNFLLHEIDLEMKKRTANRDGSYGYFRYVDDVILFGRNPNEVESNRDIFERLLRPYLRIPEDQSPLNLDKSTTEPRLSSQIDEIQSQINRIYGPLALSRYPNLSSKERLEIGNTIYDILFDGSSEPSATEELTRYTTLGLRRLIKLDYDKNKVLDLVHKLLTTVPLQSHNIKYLVAYYLEQNVLQPSDEFMKLLRMKNDAIRLYVVQLLREFSHEDVNENLWQWVLDQLTQQSNSVVAREAALTLVSAPASILLRIDLERIYLKSHPHVQAYLLELWRHLTNEDTKLPLVNVNTSNRIIKRAFFRAFTNDPALRHLDWKSDEFDDSEIISRIIYLSLQQTFEDIQ